MPLNVGARVGPYKIQAAIGAGGMGAGGYASLRTGGSEGEHQRQFAAGVGSPRP
jgi:hypothetical protein